MIVDIIVPTYKRKFFLKGTLESIQSQTYPHWHCMVAEDGETEETYSTLAPFLKDRRFSYLPGKHAGTPAVPRNRAIRHGSGEYIAFLDDDDQWLPGKLQAQLQFLNRNPDCVLLGTNAYRWPGEGRHSGLPLYFEKAPFGEITYKQLVMENYFINSSVIIPRRVLSTTGLLDEHLRPVIGEDYSFWLRVGALGKLWLMEEAFVLYRNPPPEKSIPLDRKTKYAVRAKMYESALYGPKDSTTSLSLPEYGRQAAICQRRMEFYQAGTGLIGKFAHHSKRLAKDLFSIFK